MSAAHPESPPSSPPATVTPGIEVTHDPEIPVRFVQIWLCDACLDGMGGECHTPGCALWINRAPDISLRNSPFVTILDAAPELDYEPGSVDIGPGTQVIADFPVVMTGMTPGQADTLTISESTAERDQLAAKLAHALAANQRWAETLADVQRRHAEVKCERDEAREQAARLCQPPDTLTAYESGTVVSDELAGIWRETLEARDGG